MLRTREQQRIICRGCPLAKTADLIGDSFVLIIVKELLESPKKFGELNNALRGVSTRTLASKLKMLEAKGILIHADIYSLTPKGLRLEPILAAMRDYGAQCL